MKITTRIVRHLDPPFAHATLHDSFLQISEAEAEAHNATLAASKEYRKEGVHRERMAGREPRPPILKARFTGARVVYLQRFTMEQARRHIFFRFKISFSSVFFFNPESFFDGVYTFHSTCMNDFDAGLLGVVVVFGCSDNLCTIYNMRFCLQ